MDEIKSQLVFLFGSFLSGVAVMLAYEIVNVLRGWFRPKVGIKLLLDVIFFAISAVCVFKMIFLCNHGTIRGFFVFAFGAGAILYRKAFGTCISDFIVRGGQKIVRWILRPFRFICEKVPKKNKKSEKNP